MVTRTSAKKIIRSSSMNRKHTLDKTVRTGYAIMRSDNKPLVSFVIRRVDGVSWMSMLTFDMSGNINTFSVFNREKLHGLAEWSKSLSKEVERLMDDAK